eukprot:TRINITY_DN6695_c0_g1_i1.p1 TRINITY_DN6695_c0_g1~~TRINITY_DN6695_c0_g1_i1.p1  ORF type:complete len:279 (+),score=49.83 TRINITY_DN6695_c0_g1_i1:23-859(+)
MCRRRYSTYTTYTSGYVVLILQLVIFFLLYFFFFLMIRQPPRSTHCISSAASDVYKRQIEWINKIERPILSKFRLLKTPNFSYREYLERNQIIERKGVKIVSQPQNILQKILYLKKHPLVIISNRDEFGQVTLKNVYSFLKDGIYKDPTTLPYPDLIERKVNIDKVIGGKTIAFEFRELLSLPKDNKEECDDWKRLVGIFLCGQPYQFKMWPYEKDLPQLFSKKRGYFLRLNEIYQDNSFIKSLNVKILEISKNNRDSDRIAVNHFWSDLIEFMQRPL